MPWPDNVPPERRALFDLVRPAAPDRRWLLHALLAAYPPPPPPPQAPEARP